MIELELNFQSMIIIQSIDKVYANGAKFANYNQQLQKTMSPQGLQEQLKIS